MSLLRGKFLDPSFFEQEVPTGAIDGVNLIFTLSKTPAHNKSVFLFLDGIIQAQIAHYTISGATITFISPPSLGQVPYACYTTR